MMANDEHTQELVQPIEAFRDALVEHIRLMEMLLGVLMDHPSLDRYRSERTPIDPLVAQALLPTLQGMGFSANTVV